MQFYRNVGFNLVRVQEIACHRQKYQLLRADILPKQTLYCKTAILYWVPIGGTWIKGGKLKLLNFMLKNIFWYVFVIGDRPIYGTAGNLVCNLADNS